MLAKSTGAYCYGGFGLGFPAAFGGEPSRLRSARERVCRGKSNIIVSQLVKDNCSRVGDNYLTQQLSISEKVLMTFLIVLFILRFLIHNVFEKEMIK